MATDKRAGRGKAGRLVYRIVLIALLSVFLGTSLYSLNARRVFHDAMPMPFGIGSSVVLSGSMEPTLSVNDVAVICAAKEYKVDDIVVYQSGQNLIIHRIIAVGEEGYVTKGDANNIDDGAIPASAIKGRMLFHVPVLGAAVRLLKTAPGALVIIALAALLIHRSWTRERAEDDRDLDRLKAEIRRLKEQEEQKETEGQDPHS